MAGVATINEAAYAKLLARALPRVVQTKQENERMIAELMTALVRRFEETHYPMGHAKPVEALRVLMEDRNLRQRDLIPVFGSSSVVSDVLGEKRG